MRSRLHSRLSLRSYIQAEVNTNKEMYSNWYRNSGCYWWKTVYFFSIPKYINGNTTRQCSLRYGLEGLFNFQVHEAEELW